MTMCRFCGKECKEEYHTACYAATVNDLPLEQRLGLSEKPSLARRVLLKGALAAVAGLGIYLLGQGVKNTVIPHCKADAVYADLLQEKYHKIEKSSDMRSLHSRLITFGDNSVQFTREEYFSFSKNSSRVVVTVGDIVFYDDGTIAGNVDAIETPHGWQKPSAELRPKIDAYYHTLLDAYLAQKEDDNKAKEAAIQTTFEKIEKEILRK